MLVAQIIVDVPLMQTDRPYSYLVPESMQGQIAIGMRIHVPFGKGNRLLQGFVIGFGEQENVRNLPDLKSIAELLDKVPSKYSLVILQAKRAHELAAGAEPTQEFTSVKPTLQALEEIETGNVTIHPDPESKRELARLKVIQARLAAEEEERKIKEQIAKEKEEGDKI